MPAIQPEHVTNELVNEMNRAWGEYGFVSEFSLARIKRMFAEVERKLPEALKYELKGIIATFDHDINDVHAYHQASIKLDNSPDRIGNYASSLSRVGLHSEALNLYETIYNSNNSNRGFLRSIIQELANMGRYAKAHEYAQSLNEQELDLLKVDIKTIQAGTLFANKVGISDSELEIYGHILSELLQEQGIVSTKAMIDSVEVESDEGDNSFLEILVYVKESLETAVQLGLDMCERLAKCDFSDEFSTRVTIRFVPFNA